MTVAIFFWVLAATLVFSFFTYYYLRDIVRGGWGSISDVDDLLGILFVFMTVGGWILIASYVPKISISIGA